MQITTSSHTEDPAEQLWDGEALTQITLHFSGKNRDFWFVFFSFNWRGIRAGSIESCWILFESFFLDLVFSPENSPEYLSEIQMNALLWFPEINCNCKRSALS